MCISAWSSAGFVNTSDILAATGIPEADDEVEEVLESDWDTITT
jgi:hypothetical protein